jgi:hypothetical protein
MIYNIKYGNWDRSYVLDYIRNQKSKGKFTVVDVGGTAGGWSKDVVDAIVDFNPIESNSSIRFFKCDITDIDSYHELNEYVEKNGKFDFCICSHTLEDIINPVFVTKQLAKLANGGFIAFPSKYRECARFEGNYRGYIHHRWIFDVEGQSIMAYPKVNFIENDPFFDSIADLDENRKDLSFFWKNMIDMRYVNNNYLGPSGEAVVGYYRRLGK